MKKHLFLIASFATLTFGKDCHIITSPLDLKNMNFGYSNWNASIVPIVSPKTYKFTNFLDAYSEFDTDLRKNIKEDVCTKNGWNGVVNYKITWQQTDKMYNFVATYDAFEYKK